MLRDVELAQGVTDRVVHGVDGPLPARALLRLPVEHVPVELEGGVVIGLRQDVRVGVQAVECQVGAPRRDRSAAEQRHQFLDGRVLSHDEVVEAAGTAAHGKHGLGRVSGRRLHQFAA